MRNILRTKAAVEENPVEQLALAKRRRETLQIAISEGEPQLTAAARARAESDRRIDRFEGDSLVGEIDNQKLEGERERHTAVIDRHRLAEATLRKAKRDLGLADEAIARLEPAVVAMKTAHYRRQHVKLVQQLRQQLQAAAVTNQQLFENYIAASNEFPDDVVRRLRMGLRLPHRISAGLTDLSLSELRSNVYSQNGGRFGTWLLSVESFLAECEKTEGGE